MEYRRDSKGARTWLENWGLQLLIVTCAASADLALQLLAYLAQLTLLPAIYFSAASFALMIGGATLIGYAKLPSYQKGWFFRFGIKSVPAYRAKHYRWGWRLFPMGVFLSLC